MKLSLPSTTICCIETRHPGLAEISLQRSIERAGIEFGDVLLLTDTAMTGFARRFDFPMRVLPIAPIASKEDYSRFVLRELPDLIRGDHALLTQWDGFVLNAAAWRHEFLGFDYIGAPWTWLDPPYRVGNGGFSLRSRRLMVAAREIITEIDENEDVMICRRHRAELEARFHLRFADEATAQRFAFERGSADAGAFGFHGLFNFEGAFSPLELERYLEELPIALLRSPEAAELAASLFVRGRPAQARSLVRRRLRSDPVDEPALALARQMWRAGDECWCGSARALRECHGRAAAPAGVPGRTLPEAFNNDVLLLIPPGLPRVLEVGCGGGEIARAYRERNTQSEFVGIESEPGALARARNHCSRVVPAEIEEMSDAELRELGPAGCWVLTDTVGRMRDPWRQLARIRTMLRAGDCVVACIANIQHWSVQARLAGGDFRYEEAGLPDRGHLRFFTRASLIRLFAEAGLRIEAGRQRFLPLEGQDGALNALRAYAQALGVNAETAASDALVYQHVVRAVPAQ